jgi:hypothetical protein
MGLAIPYVDSLGTEGYSTAPSPFSMTHEAFRKLGCRRLDHDQDHSGFAAFVDPAASKLRRLAAYASAVTSTAGRAPVSIGRGDPKAGKETAWTSR